MDRSLEGVLLVLVTSLLSFLFLDYLAGTLFLQWNGQPLPCFLRVVLFVVLVLVRTIIAEATMLERFGGHLKKENLLLSSVIFGPPLLVLQLVTGTDAVLDLVSVLSPFAPRTFAYAVFSFVILLLMFEFSRLSILYLIRSSKSTN